MVARRLKSSAGAETASPPDHRVVSRLALIVAAAALLQSTLVAGFAIPPQTAFAADQVARLQAANARLETRLAELETARPTIPDWPGITEAVEPSVFMVIAGDFLGSAWVVSSDRAGSTLVTNYHVIAAAWEGGDTAVELHQGDQVYAAQVSSTDRANDLALIRVDTRFPALATAASRPPLASPVMSVGSPLGFDGTVATGVVSAYRSVDGSDWLQFSAPISPGNSGGPVVDGRGAVVGVATEKAVGDGVEALAFAIPVQTVCTALITCPDQV